MEAALAAIRSREMGYHKAAKHFGVPRTTLFRLSKRDNNVPDCKWIGLHPQTEDMLVNHLLQMEQDKCGLTRDDVKRIIFEFAELNRIPNPFKSDDNYGRGWLKRFLKRHADRLSLYKTTGMSFPTDWGFI